MIITLHVRVNPTVATTDMEAEWYTVAKDFQPLAASLVALWAAGTALRSAKRQSDTALRVAERQVQSSLVLQRNQLADAWRKSQVDRFRLTCNSLAEMVIAADGIQAEMQEYRLRINSFATSQGSANGAIPTHRSDTLWDDIVSKTAIREQFPILISRGSAFDNAPITAQSLFYSVMKEVPKYEAVRRDIIQSSESKASIKIVLLNDYVHKLDQALEAIREPVAKLHGILTSTADRMIAEEMKQEQAITAPRFEP